MTKQDILQYVMNTPYNTNPAVLASLLDGLEGGEQGTLNMEDIYSLFSTAYHGKIADLGGEDAEHEVGDDAHEVGDDFWAEATEDGAQTNATTITEANYKMWTWMERVFALDDITRVFNLTSEQSGEVGQILQNNGNYYDAISRAALLTNTTLPRGK